MHDPKEFNDPEDSLNRMEELGEEVDEIEPDKRDLEVEEEMKLTGKEEEWLDKLQREIKEWKASRSQLSGDVHDAVLHLDPDDISPEDIELFHAFEQVTDTPSPHFRQKFGKLLRKRQTEFDANRDTTAYRLAKILESLSPKED